MRSSRARRGFALIALSLLWSPSSQGTVEPRIEAAAAADRIEALEVSLKAQVAQVADRYGYEKAHETLQAVARAQGQDLGRAAKPLATRLYALWAGVARRVDGELARLATSGTMIGHQTFALTRDVEWLEHAGSRIHRDLEIAQSCLDELVERAMTSNYHSTHAKNGRAAIKRRKAELARLPGSGDADPQIVFVGTQVRYHELAAASARATAYGLEDDLSALASKQWMPALEPQKQRREISIGDIELPLALLPTKPMAPWVTGASGGAWLAEAVADFDHRRSVAALTRDAELAMLERAADSRDAVDKGRVRSLQLEGLSLARRARRLSSGLERLSELRSVVVFANGKEIFKATRPRLDELERLRESVLHKSGALNEMLDAVLLLRRQFIFHAMAAERGRGLRATGKAMDIRPTIQKVFASSRAAHGLERAQRSDLESFYKLDHSTLSEPQHLRDAAERLLRGTLASGSRQTPSQATGLRSHPPDAQATLTVARLLAKLSDDRAHIPLKAAKRTVRRWKFPVPGYPERASDALQVLADDLTAWVHFPATVWSETAFESLVTSLRADIMKLRSWTTRHRALDGLALDERVTVRDGMHIEVLIELNAEHEGALLVEFAGDVLTGEGIYLANTPGLLFATPRLNIGEKAGTKTAIIRIRLP